MVSFIIQNLNDHKSCYVGNYNLTAFDYFVKETWEMNDFFVNKKM